MSSSVRAVAESAAGGRRGSAATRQAPACGHGLPVQPLGARWCAGTGHGLVARAAQDGHRGPGAGAVRRSAAGDVRDAARQQPADLGQRLDGAARTRPVVLAAHDPRPGRRAVRRAAPARAVHTRADADRDGVASGAGPGHVPRSRRQRQLPLPAADDQAGRGATSPTRSPSRRTRAELVRAVPRRQLRDPVQRCRARRLPGARRRIRRTVRRSSSAAGTRSARGSACCWPHSASSVRRCACGSAATVPTRRAACPVRRRHAHRMARPAHRRRQDRAAARRRRVLRSVAAR